jgi:hypothetical protein
VAKNEWGGNHLIPQLWPVLLRAVFVSMWNLFKLVRVVESGICHSIHFIASISEWSSHVFSCYKIKYGMSLLLWWLNTFLVFKHSCHVTSYAIVKSRTNCRARNQMNKMLSPKVYTTKTCYGKIPNTISYHVIFRTSNQANWRDVWNSLYSTS